MNAYFRLEPINGPLPSCCGLQQVVFGKRTLVDETDKKLDNLIGASAVRSVVVTNGSCSSTVT